MFCAGDLMLVTKADLIPVLVDFDPPLAETLALWLAWLDGLLVQARGGVALRANIQTQAAAAIH